MTIRTPVVGILGLQGDYQKHGEVLDAIGVASRVVRAHEDFDAVDRLIIPGGESTVMVRLLKRLDLETAFVSFIRSRPVWGTCAGMILLASRVNDDSIIPYSVIDIEVDRNGYGRQVFSTVIPSILSLNGARESFDMVFIRAPRVTRVGGGVSVLLTRGNDPVLLAQKNVMVSTFHPELTGSTRLHEYFVRKFCTPAAGRGEAAR